MSSTVQETIDSLRETLLGYIEATYHIADAGIVDQRRSLLETVGITHQTPYLESTPRYQTGSPYNEMADLPAAARAIYLALAHPVKGKPLLFDPPYKHQAESIAAILQDFKNAMIMTGTGSGKTESFLLPILGKFAIEAKEKNNQFSNYRAVRAMVLYPMNALVNDQLGRLRLLFGDERVRSTFNSWCGRSVTFARYTSRTPYAGIRTKKKDGRRLKSIGEFFVDIEEAARRHASGSPVVAKEDERASNVQRQLHKRGKWPAKPNLTKWFGSGHWQDKNENFRRAVTLEDDAELLTRHEVQEAAPDLLITNYSMLEYMMLRPVERTIFEQTKAWLANCPDEKFLIVLDEAHLYRGAQGAEVGLLLRRLRDRLQIPIERFQVICATASFSEEGKLSAGEFGSQLSGADPQSFALITGALNERPNATMGSSNDIEALASLNIEKFFSDNEQDRQLAITDFLNFRKIQPTTDHGADLYNALVEYGPFAKLVNETMKAALSFEEIRASLFGEVNQVAGAKAVNSLIAMGSRARLKAEDASLLPCRVHAFYRGLPGLWACMDPHCTELKEESRGSPIGKLYSQPHERCGCGAPVLEYFTCRYCGTSYARAYASNIQNVGLVFPEPGQNLRTQEGFVQAFEPIDLLLEKPSNPLLGLEANYDLRSGLIDPDDLGERRRKIYLRPTLDNLNEEENDEEGADEEGDAGRRDAGLGQFVPCGCCDQKVRGGKSSVQDHLTKGDQPFQALVSAQIKVQPPSLNAASEFAPLRGRKVLTFSDSRQVAARLAPALQVFSLRDTLRALLPLGYRILAKDPGFAPSLRLEHAWIAVIVAAHWLGIRLRPELEGTEIMPRPQGTIIGAQPDTAALFALLSTKPPANLLLGIVEVLRHNLLGLEPLAVASIREAPNLTSNLTELPDIPGLAETAEAKVAVTRAWLRVWARRPGIWFKDMPPGWWSTGGEVRPHKGEFTAMKHVLNNPAHKKAFKKDWLPRLLLWFTDTTPAGQRMEARNLDLEIGGEWRRCSRCTSVHRPISSIKRCVDCGSDHVHTFDPSTDEVFNARKGFYRHPIISALTEKNPQLMTIIAAEHTAQLNAAQSDAAFSKAEHNEMQFQDIDLAWKDIDRHKSTSIDVLSSTTTMEVGIDIGELSGVALRNMPPGRANYQQRAGRAGRRGNAVATVMAFGSADSHDDHYFTKPQEMIRGRVIDPRLTLENPDIARRHIRAFLLQRYHEAQMTHLDPSDTALANLFAVLGSVKDFRDGNGLINRKDLEDWLKKNEAALRISINGWLPSQLSETDRNELLIGFVKDLLESIDAAIFGSKNSVPSANEEVQPAEQATDEKLEAEPAETSTEVDPQPDNDIVADKASDNLLGRLLDWGVLPRYAFPTDVANFYVFSAASTGFRPVHEFAPSQGLNIALSQYAPNKQIWIAGKQYTSKAIYSPFQTDRIEAWHRRRMYYECERCGHAKTDYEYDNTKRHELITCEACQTPDSFGPAKPWFRPPGFAHLWGVEAPSVPDDPNETAYATRAKLIMPSATGEVGIAANPRLRVLAERPRLLVSNSGPEGKGYNYCVRCGRIESTQSPDNDLELPHALPYPSDDANACPGKVSKGIVLGTDFPTDIALFSIKLAPEFCLLPGHSETESAMRTICEALALAASRLLDIEIGEILAEFRPALNDQGAAGMLVEVFLYDTLAGGAGFSPLLVPIAEKLFKHALTILEECPERCDTSCYRCLRSFRNKLDHRLLDRHVGAQLIRHILTGELAPFSKSRAALSLKILADDLERQLGNEFSFTRAFETEKVTIAPLIAQRHSTGAQTHIDIHSPIAPTISVYGATSGVILIDDLKIRRHLGEAVEKVAKLLN